MRTATIAAAWLIPLALCARTAAAQQDRSPSAADAAPDVETVGTGERRIAPDRATVLLQVETKAASAAAAAAQNGRTVQAVREALRRIGVDSAVTTASYNVGPDYEPPRPMDREGGPRRVGYAARTVVRVQLTRLNDVGQVIDAALGGGATGVDGVFFEASTADAARREALADAAQAARRDAEALARSLGGQLGSLISSSTASGMDPRRANVMMRMAGGMAGSATQITPNEIVVTAGVVTRWRFVPAPAGR